MKQEFIIFLTRQLNSSNICFI